MTEKNIKKLLVGLGVPIEKHQEIIDKSNKDDEEWDVNDVLEAAKKYAEPLIRPKIEQEARKGGASGAIKKVLKSVYDATKDDKSGTFEEWEKTVEGKDYADVVMESISNAKMKGLTNDQAVKELNDKLAKALKANEESTQTIDKINKEWQSKMDQRDLTDAINRDLTSLPLKPIKSTAYKFFLAELEEEGIETRLHEGKAALFKKGEVAPLQNEKGTAIVKLQDKFTEWANENSGLFVQSAGSGGSGSGHQEPDPKNIKVDEQKGTVTKGTNRPVPKD